MKKTIAMLLCIASFSVFSTPVTVVEVGNFFCGHCNDMEAFTPEIKKVTEATGGEFEFTPIFYGDFPRYPAQAYMADMNQIDIVQDQIKKALFTSANILRMPMKTADSTCRAISNQVSSVSFKQCINAIKSGKGMQRIGKTFKLVQYLIKHKYLGDTIDFPVFVIEQDNKIQSVVSSANNADMHILAQQVISNIKELS